MQSLFRDTDGKKKSDARGRNALCDVSGVGKNTR
jgi:hypothetical protein